MGIQRWGKDGVDYWMSEADDGRYVLFTDHEQVVAELRSALAAKSAEVEGKVVVQIADLGRLCSIGESFGQHYDMLPVKRVRAILNAAMEKSNEHQDQ